MILNCNKKNSNIKYKMDGESCSSTRNLNRYLTAHMDKIDLSIKKQADFMNRFLKSDGNSKNQIVNI